MRSLGAVEFGINGAVGLGVPSCRGVKEGHGKEGRTGTCWT